MLDKYIMYPCTKRNLRDVKKTNSNTRLDPFENADMVFDNYLVNHRTECTPPPRFNKINSYRRKPQIVRNENDNSGYGITDSMSFDFATNEFTNPISSEKNRYKYCPQNFFCNGTQ